jgi:hypothetical protein
MNCYLIRVVSQIKGMFGWMEENVTILFLFFGCLASNKRGTEWLLESLYWNIKIYHSWNAPALPKRPYASAPLDMSARTPIGLPLAIQCFHLLVLQVSVRCGLTLQCAEGEYLVVANGVAKASWLHQLSSSRSFTVPSPVAHLSTTTTSSNSLSTPPSTADQ